MSETAAPAPASPTQEADITSALGRRSVVLVGMMGAGKSTIGRRLAARLRLQTEDPTATVSRLLEAREPTYRTADLTIASRDVPHDRIVDECIDALRARLCADAPSAQPTTDGISVTP